MIERTHPSTYTIRSIQEMLGLSRGVISGLVASGFVVPSRGARNEYRFTFQDVVLLRTAVELQAAQIPPRKILAALRKLRATLPAELPLTGLRITARSRSCRASRRLPRHDLPTPTPVAAPGPTPRRCVTMPRPSSVVARRSRRAIGVVPRPLIARC